MSSNDAFHLQPSSLIFVEVNMKQLRPNSAASSPRESNFIPCQRERRKAWPLPAGWILWECAPLCAIQDLCPQSKEVCVSPCWRARGDPYLSSLTELYITQQPGSTAACVRSSTPMWTGCVEGLKTGKVKNPMLLLPVTQVGHTDGQHILNLVKSNNKLFLTDAQTNYQKMQIETSRCTYGDQGFCNSTLGNFFLTSVLILTPIKIKSDPRQEIICVGKKNTT